MMRSLFISFAILLPVAFAGSASAQLFDICDQTPNAAVCQGRNSSGTQTATDNSVIRTLVEVIRILLFVVGVAAVIMIMVGGFMYITSTGDSSSVNKAKNTILYAVIGLVVALVAQSIIFFVLSRL
jgi:hypothetical protein